MREVVCLLNLHSGDLYEEKVSKYMVQIYV